MLKYRLGILGLAKTLDAIAGSIRAGMPFFVSRQQIGTDESLVAVLDVTGEYFLWTVVQLVSLEVLLSGIDLIAAGIVACIPSRSASAAGSLVATARAGGLLLGSRHCFPDTSMRTLLTILHADPAQHDAAGIFAKLY